MISDGGTWNLCGVMWLCQNAYKIKLYLKSVYNSFKPRNCPAVYQRRANPLWTWWGTMMIPGCSLFTALQSLYTLTLTWHHLWFTSRWSRPNLLMSLTPTLVQQICWAVQVSFRQFKQVSYENIVVKKGLFIDQHQRPPTDSAVRGKGAPLRCNELFGFVTSGCV